jgi:hypothetical protein
MASTSEIKMGNDEFILYIRKTSKICSITNDDLGKYIWIWLKERGANKTYGGKKQLCLWGKDAANRDKDNLPYTATQFEFDRNLLPDLYNYLDELAMM